jgi:hypothetical protein
MIPASMVSLVLGAMCGVGCVASEPALPVHVAAAEMPAPGYCRIWYPDRAVRDQPRAVPCRSVRAQLPAGATLVTGATELVQAP